MAENGSRKTITLLGVLIGLAILGAIIAVMTAQPPAPVTHGSQAPDVQSTTGPIPPGGPGGAIESAGLYFEPGPQSKIIDNVPAYIWRDGCAPTSGGMILGYWDYHWDLYDYDWIVPGNAAAQNTFVDQMIASSQHETEYAYPIDAAPTLRPDKSELPIGDEHTSNSLADFMSTSFSSRENYYGWSWYSDMPDGFIGYLNSVNPDNFIVTAYNVRLNDGTLTWASFMNSIDKGIPMLLLVDSTKDGQTDHFIPAFGYDNSGPIKYYAAFNTWDNITHWYVWAPMNIQTPYGVYGGTVLTIQMKTPDDTPTYMPTIPPPETDTPEITQTATQETTQTPTPTQAPEPPEPQKPDLSGVVIGLIISNIISGCSAVYAFLQLAKVRKIKPIEVEKENEL